MKRSNKWKKKVEFVCALHEYIGPAPCPDCKARYEKPSEGTGIVEACSKDSCGDGKMEP